MLFSNGALQCKKQLLFDYDFVCIFLSTKSLPAVNSSFFVRLKMIVLYNSDQPELTKTAINHSPVFHLTHFISNKVQSCIVLCIIKLICIDIFYPIVL